MKTPRPAAARRAGAISNAVRSGAPMTPPDSTLPALPRPVCAQAYLAARITDWQAWLDRKPARKPRALDVTHPAERSERKRRKPTLANIVKQARKAGIDPARIEIKPDGSY